jgi:hypothetical protein
LYAVRTAERLGGAGDDLARIGRRLRLRHTPGTQTDGEQHAGELFR